MAKYTLQKGVAPILWHNEPASWNPTDRGLFAIADAATDFWRQTSSGEVHDNGHFYYHSVDGDFKASVKLTGGYRSQYDQAGIMVRVDENAWLKCGVEFVDGQQYISAVVTRDYSDWSMVSALEMATIWLSCERRGATLSAYYSLDGTTFEMMRQTSLVMPLPSRLRVGMMLAAPVGDGFSVRFDDYFLSIGNTEV